MAIRREGRARTPTGSAQGVLVVDDDEVGRTELAVALRARGFETMTAADGLSALEYLRWGMATPVCIVLDMRMPVMTGCELVRALAAEPRLRDIPLIGVTSGRWKPSDASGFLALFEKPVDLDELATSISQCLASLPSSAG
jgi:CheY-like chemotaxis protein